MKVKVKNSQGAEQYVPAHWLEHEVLGKGFTPVKEDKAVPVKGSATVKKEGKKDA